MSDYVLAILSPATHAELFAADDPELPLRVARAAGEALDTVEHAAGCRVVLVEREVEPQLGRLVQRLRQVIPAVDIVWLAPAVGPGPRQELHTLRVDWLDRGLPSADLQRTLRHRFRRAKLQAESGIIGRDPHILEILEIALQVGPTDIPVLITGPSRTADIEQILVRGHVHADPHPGNFLITPDGKLALLDFGCTLVLDKAVIEDEVMLAAGDSFAVDFSAGAEGFVFR